MKHVNLSAPFSRNVGQRCFCNTSRFLMILSFGIWPLCLHMQDQAVGIKRPLRQCPGRIWSHNLPVQVPASCKHCKYNAMQIQHFSHFFTSTSFYIVVYLQSLLTPSGIFNIPGCGLLVQWRAQGSLQRAWCGACCTNAHLVILPTLLKTADVFLCHFCPAPLAMVFMLFILSCPFNWVCKRINICELSQCAAFLEGAPPSWHKQKVYSTSACDLKGKQSLEYAYIRIQPYAKICEWVSCIHVHYYVMLADLT